MPASIISRSPRRLTIQVEVPIPSRFVDCEDAIRETLNEAGRLATQETLKAFDADGAPIERGGARYSSKGRILKIYETPYGPVDLDRYVYQGPRGGRTFSPLDDVAGIVGSATPAFARIVAHKYADAGSSGVQRDLQLNHGRPASKTLIESLATEVAVRARMEGGATRPDAPPGLEKMITRVVVLLDERPLGGVPDLPTARIAAIELYDRHDRLQHVSHVARVPEDEREGGAFLDDVRRPLARIVRLHPEAEVLGISAGQDDFVAFLRETAGRQVLDPARLREELAGAITAIPRPDADRLGPRLPSTPGEIRDWVAGKERHLREDPEQALDRVAEELRRMAAASGDAGAIAGVETVIRRLGRWRDAGLLGYGEDLPDLVFDRPGPLSELAGVLLGDRFRHARLRMGIDRARIILLLRELTRTPERWTAYLAAIDGRMRRGPRD